MFTQTFITLVLIFGFILSCVGGFTNTVPPDPQGKLCPEPATSPFRYVIVYNDEIDDLGPNGSKPTFRVVEVLLDPQSFSEVTLRQLFELLSKRFPKSDKLFIHVHTNLDDVYTPEEAEQILPSAKCNTLRGDKYPWATYNRSSEYEGFNYSANSPGEGVRIVKLRNRAP